MKINQVSSLAWRFSSTCLVVGFPVRSLLAIPETHSPGPCGDPNRLGSPKWWTTTQWKSQPQHRWDIGRGIYFRYVGMDIYVIMIYIYIIHIYIYICIYIYIYTYTYYICGFVYYTELLIKESPVCWTPRCALSVLRPSLLTWVLSPGACDHPPVGGKSPSHDMSAESTRVQEKKMGELWWS